MATVLLRLFDLPALSCQEPPANFAGGLNIQLLLDTFADHMPFLSQSFLSTAPAALNQAFFNPHNERIRLTTHMYGEHNNARQVRAVANTHLIDCVEHPLKSLTNYRDAAAIYINTPLREYLKQHILLIPGDWPSQFYQRQLAYNEPLNSPLRNTTPTMGPLHVSLNAQENVVLKFITFFHALYLHLFKKQLAKKPKPWRITLLLELVVGAWTLLRQPVLDRLGKFKDTEFLTLLNLIDNYAPLSLSIYSVLYKANNYELYNLAMHQVWCMYFTFKRKHYDKSPLVWLANTAYWEHTKHPLHTTLRNHLYICDEYPVENFHSLLRARTNDWDTPQQIQGKARWINRNKHALQHFSTWFVPPKSETMTVNQLRQLKLETAKYLLQKIADICANPGAGTELPRLPRQRRNTTRWRLPNIFGETTVKNVLLPLGFQFDGYRPVLLRLGFANVKDAPAVHPSQERRCDYLQCAVPDAPLPANLHPCGHSFHQACAPARQWCYICREGILAGVRDKAMKANQSIFSPDANIDQQSSGSSESSEDEEDNDEIDVNGVQAMDEAAAATATELLVQTVNNLPLVPLL